jgi:hypothetical protein
MDYEETFVSVAKMITIRTLIVVVQFVSGISHNLMLKMPS